MKLRAYARHLAPALLALLLGACSGMDMNVRPTFRSGEATAAEPPGSAHERGVAEYKAGHYGLAVQHFRAAIADDQTSVASLNGLAASYDKLGRFDLAERYYRQALIQNPGSTQTLNNLGFSALLQGHFDLAVAFLNEALDLGGGSDVVAANLRQAEDGLTQQARHEAQEREAAKHTVPAKLSQPEPRGLSLVRASFAVQHLVDHGAAPGAPRQPASARPDKPVPTRAAVLELVPDLPAAPPVPVQMVALPPAAPPATRIDGVRIEVSNGAGRNGMAARLRTFLGRHKFDVRHITNADNFNYKATVIFYRQGAQAAAETLVALLPGKPSLVLQNDLRTDVLVRLGADLLHFDSTLNAKTA